MDTILYYVFVALPIICGIGLVASIVGLFVKRWRKYAICYLWWALFPFCFPDYAKEHDIIKKSWKRVVLFFVSPCAFSVYLVIILSLFGLFFAMDSPSITHPTSIDFHNSKDLEQVTKVEFPEVMPVDSFEYNEWGRRFVEVKFVPVDSMTKKDFEKFDKACETDSNYWRKDSIGYTYRISTDYEGSEMEVYVPLKGDTITIRDTWAR